MIDKLVKSRIFWIGLVVRLLLVSLGGYVAASEWYVPFLTETVRSGSWDPWTVWLQRDGDPAAFPYGLAMLTSFVPMMGFIKLFSEVAVWAYFATLLLADIALLLTLLRFREQFNRKILVAYWLSPVILVATYLFGYNDVIPILFLTLSTLALKKCQWALAGVLAAVAVSAKLSMALAVPFLLIFFLRNRALQPDTGKFVGGILVATAVLWIPLIASPGAGNMILTNREAGKLLGLVLGTNTPISIFLVPLAYVLVLYGAWTVRRLSPLLLQAFYGLAFLAVVLLSPAPPGWFVWIVPLLTFYAVTGDRKARSLTVAFGLAFTLYSLLYEKWPSEAVDALSRWSWQSVPYPGDVWASLSRTILFAVGLVMGILIWRDMIHRNEFVRLGKKPIVIGIAGDSGSGKDTTAQALVGAFGGRTVAHLTGDDYHLWDRTQPIWRALTHLNPRANDLERFQADAAALVDGRSIHVRRYDHELGRRSHPERIDSNDIVIISGLHALYSEELRRIFTVSIYLDMDDSLRRVLKMERDKNDRGHSSEAILHALTRREPDAEVFIHPQRKHADLVLSVRSSEEIDFADDGRRQQVPRTYLEVYARNGLDEQTIARVLIGLCGLHVDFVRAPKDGESHIVIEGEISPADVGLAVHMGCPMLSEFLPPEPYWHGGTLGLVQIMILMRIEQALNRRLVS